MSLTDTRIRDAKPRKGPYKLSDGEGLHLDIRPTGAKLWRYRYRIAGRENLFALGEYAKAPAGETKQEAEARRGGGRFTLAEARAERERCRDLVRQGIHPSHQRARARIEIQHSGANTFEAVAREWLQRNTEHWAPRTLKQRERLLDQHVFPHIGRLPIKQITPAHILAILKRLEKDAPSCAVIAQQSIGATFRHAAATLRVDSDPTYALRGAIKTPPTKHKTPLTKDEIPAFFKALDEYTGAFQTKAAMRLLWLTLMRTNEALAAKWTEFDLDAAEWRIPGERMKKRTVTPHIVPLPSQAVALLTTLRGVTGNGEYLFPNRSSLKRPASIGLLWKACDGMGYGGTFSPHAIRTTGSTMLNEMGFNSDWIERQLAHHDRNETRASYNGAKYLDQRRSMMQQWADYLTGIASGKVTPIKRAA